MDSFGNYPREESFDPFAVMLFKGLQVVAFLFFIALLAMNPEAKSGKIDSKAEFIISIVWPDNHPDDIDLYVEDPVGNIVWYHERYFNSVHECHSSHHAQQHRQCTVVSERKALCVLLRVRYGFTNLLCVASLLWQRSQ